MVMGPKLEIQIACKFNELGLVHNWKLMYVGLVFQRNDMGCILWMGSTKSANKNGLMGYKLLMSPSRLRGIEFGNWV